MKIAPAAVVGAHPEEQPLVDRDVDPAAAALVHPVGRVGARLEGPEQVVSEHLQRPDVVGDAEPGARERTAGPSS